MCADGLKEVVQALEQRGDTTGFRQRARHTGEGRIRVSSEGVFRALRDLAGNHGGAQGTVKLSERVAPPAGLQNRACHFRGTRLLS